MEISELLSAEVIESLGDDAAAKLQGAFTEMQKKIKDAEGRVGGITEQKKKAQALVDDLQSRLEELEQRSMSGDEKTQRQLEKLQQQLAQREKEFESLKTEAAAKERRSKLAQVVSKIKFLDDVAPETREVLVERHLHDIDLDDADVVSSMVKTFEANNKALLRGDAPSGTGDTGSREPGSLSSEKMPSQKEIMTMSDAEFKEQRDQLWEKANAEAVVLAGSLED